MQKAAETRRNEGFGRKPSHMMMLKRVCVFWQVEGQGRAGVCMSAVPVAVHTAVGSPVPDLLPGKVLDFDCTVHGSSALPQFEAIALQSTGTGHISHTALARPSNSPHLQLASTEVRVNSQCQLQPFPDNPAVQG